MGAGFNVVHKVPVQTDRAVEAESRQAWLITHPHPARQAGFDVFHPLLPPSLSHSSPDGSPSQLTTHRMANNRFLFLFIGSRRIGSRPEQSICRYIVAATAAAAVAAAALPSTLVTLTIRFVPLFSDCRVL